MKHTQRILMTEMVTAIVACILCIVLYETEVLESGIWATMAQQEFLVLSVMEIAVMALIPISLRLFKFNSVKNKLTASPSEALLKFGTIRMMMLVVPLFLCVLFYYLFMKAAFGYLAIILLLCLGFVVPTMNKCLAETSSES